ncbi:MAG TPA: hypothetical protein VMV48_00330 [Gallionellaceae bacterium]|nr:hypothetical protein [Gallionellaceae bacterium]
MKPRRDITPYMCSADSSINAMLTLLKVFKRIRTIDATHKPASRYQARLKSKQATRRAHLHIVR